MISTRMTLAELATTVPAASRIFHHHRLDFCCGGQRTLEEACAHAGIDAERIASDLEASPGALRAARWDQEPLAALVEHIITRYHEPLRQELPRLVAMARKVEAKHADEVGVPAGLTRHLELMEAEVADHLAKEEQVLFPLIRSGRGALATTPVMVMRHEHDDHGRNLRRVRELTSDLTPPAEACPTWHALYLGLGELERELHEHIHLENNVLFPRALADDR